MKQIVFICLLVFTIFSMQDHFEPQELDIFVRVKTPNQVITEQQMTLIYSPKFFELEAKRLPIELLIPRDLLNQSILEVYLNENKKEWKITNEMFVEKQNYGLESVFGIDNILISSQINTDQVYPETIYLKILYDEIYQKIDEEQVTPPFIINQKLILGHKSYKSLKKTEQVVKIKLIPDLFTFGFTLNDILIDQIDTYYNLFETIYLKSHNTPLNQNELQMLYDFYVKSLKQLQIQRSKKNNSRLIKQLTQAQIKNTQSQMAMLKQLMTHDDYAEVGSLVKNVLLNFIHQSIELLKKAVFFNQSGFYSFIIIVSAVSGILFIILYPLFILGVIGDKFANFKDNIGISLTSAYLVIALCVNSFLQHQMASPEYAILFLFFLQPILKIKFQKTKSFPYYRPCQHPLYQDYRRSDNKLIFSNGIFLLMLLTGYHILFGKHIQGQKSNNLKVADIISLLMTQYCLFLLALNQFLINQKLKSVRHLSKSYIILFSLLALMNDYSIFLEPQPFVILLKLKQDVIAVLLIYQCLKWHDLGQGTRRHSMEKQKQQYTTQREAQLLDIKQA